MICVLIGYPNSQKIVPASKYLTNKYLPKEFDIIYLNYTGEINKWSSFLQGYLTALGDKYIIFSLDDYLIADTIDMKLYQSALGEMGGDIVCAKLCDATPEEHKEYPVTTQWTIWDRGYLISLLEKVSNPWEFEIHGSRIFDKKVIHRPCIKYFTNSSISSRWEGIKFDGLKEEDLKYIKENLL